MKKKEFFIIFLGISVLALTFGCTKTKRIHEYSEQLQINFPKDMTLVHYKVLSDFQDYSIESIYDLSFNQKNDLLEEIFEDICDVSTSDDKLFPCWKRCDDYYSYEYRDEEYGLVINIVFVAENDVSILNIYEVKL